MEGTHRGTGTGGNTGGFAGGNGRGMSRRASERQKKIADRDQERKAAESVRDMFDASCIDASGLMRKIYRITDTLNITKPKVRIRRYVDTLDNAIVDTYEEIKHAEESVKEAESGFNAEREERTRIKHTYTKAEAILKDLENEKRRLQGEKKELAKELLNIRESEDNADKWTELEGELNGKNNELRGLEKDIDDHKEDMSELRTEMVYTQNRYLIEKRGRITFKNDLTRLRKVRDNLEYIRATLEPYILEDPDTSRRPVVGTERAKKLAENGKKLIKAYANKEAAYKDNGQEEDMGDINFENLEHEMPKEMGRDDESKLYDRFNKIMEDIEEDEHEI